VTNGEDKPEFDETAVLEELERLRGAIRLARTKREEKVAEFETFMRDARMASKREAARAVGVPEDELELQSPAPPLPPPVQIPEVHPATPVPAATWSPPTSTFQPAAPPPPTNLSRLDDMSEANAAFPDTVAPRRAIDKYIIAGGAAVLVVALLLVSWKGGDSGTSASPAPRTAAPGAQGAASPGAAGPANTGQASQSGGAAATPAAAPLPLQVELVAVRKVWMRVTVDGDRAIEDEVEQGQRLRFGANKSIVIRAGDAGSVTMAVDGQAPTPLGPAGQTVTRTLVPRAK
jgi:hypothetical protein